MLTCQQTGAKSVTQFRCDAGSRERRRNPGVENLADVHIDARDVPGRRVPQRCALPGEAGSQTDRLDISTTGSTRRGREVSGEATTQGDGDGGLTFGST